MQIYTSTLSAAVTTTPTLNSAYIGHPEVLERVTRQICSEYNFYFTGMALGYGRYATTGEITKNTGKLTIGNDYITWAVMPRTRTLVTLAANIAAASGGSGAAFTVTLSTNDNWIQPGMILKYTYPTTGTSIIFLVVTGPSANSSNWDYTFKIVSSASTTVPTQIDSGLQLGQTTIAQASCASTTTYKPRKLYDQFRNYNTTMKPKHTLCKDGIQTATWYVSKDGQKCWQPQEEYQFDMECLKDLEFGIVYNVTNVNSSGTVYNTDTNSNAVMIGDGLLAQISSGNLVSWDVSTYWNQPSAYVDFFNILKDTIENWSVTYGVNNDVTLFVHTGTKGFGFLQEVLKDNVDQSGGAGMVFVKNYKGRNEEGDEAMMLSRNICKYKFASFTLVLLKCSVFDDPGVHGTPFTGSTGANDAPLESFRMLIAPDSDCEGYPLIQLFFRGGCGLDDVWNNSYRPGTIDPTKNYGKSSINVTEYSGYDVYKEVEYNLVVRDPSKFLNFQPFES